MREGSSAPYGQGLTRGWPCYIFRCRELSWSTQTGVQAGWMLAPACAVGEPSVLVFCSELTPFSNLELVPGA